MHHHTLILDTMFRDFWFNQGRFGVSQGLLASARMKHKSSRTIHKA